VLQPVLNDRDGACWPVVLAALEYVSIRRAMSERSTLAALGPGGERWGAPKVPFEAATRPDLPGTIVLTHCDAVVKVPPSVGCVKYKAQHVVLPS
jgi:hypothetical protein